MNCPLAPAAEPDGSVVSGVGNPTENVTLPNCTTGVLILTYQESSSLGGVVIMPWGLSSLEFPVNYGGNPSQQEWVATDLRQVMVGDVAYQAKLSLWSTQGSTGDWLMMRTVEVLMVIVILTGAFIATSYFAVLPWPRQVSPLDLGRLSLTTMETLNSGNDLSASCI